MQVRAVTATGDGPWSSTATGTQALPTGASAARSFSAASVAPGGTLTVTITAAKYGSLGRVTETLPAGFSYVSSTHGSVTHPVDGDSQKVRFILQGGTSFTYTVTASDVEGSYTFSGILRDSDRNDHAVGGDSTVTVGAAAQAASATRSFSAASIAPGGTVTVTINARNYGSLGRVVENVPSGFTTEGGSQTVTIRLPSPGPRTETYTVTATDSAGPHTFSGTLWDEERNHHTVGGAATVTVSSVDPLVARYDANGNNRIDLEEVYRAIDDYFEYVDPITLEEVYELVDLYFDGG